MGGRTMTRVGQLAVQFSLGIAMILAVGASPAFALQEEEATLPHLVVGVVISAEPHVVPGTGEIVTDVQVVESGLGGATTTSSFAMPGGESGGMGMWSERFTDLSEGDTVIAGVCQSGGELTAVSAPLVGTSVAGSTATHDEKESDESDASDGDHDDERFIWGDGIHWADETLPVQYSVNASGMPSGATAAVVAAAQTWENDAGSYMDFTSLGTTSKYSNASDGVNVVGAGNLGATSTIAQCCIWYYPETSHIVEFGITYNTTAFAFATDGTPWAFDVQGIGTHEFGHTLHLRDLYDSDDASQVMYGYGYKADASQRVLGLGDEAGIRAIYPVKVVTGALTGTVKSNAGAPLSGAAVAVPGCPSTTTGSNGSYAVSGIAPGTYTVSYLKAGHTKKTVTSTISAGSTVAQDATLTVDPGTLLDAGFENGTAGATLASPPWAVFGTPRRTVYDTARAKVGTKSAWIQGPTTAAYGGASESGTALMSSNGAEIRFWLYADSTNENRVIRDDPGATVPAIGVYQFQLDNAGRIAVLSYRPAANGYNSGSNTTVGAYTTGWTQYRIVSTFSGTNAQTYTLSMRASESDPWTQLKAAGATGYDIPMRGSSTITSTRGMLLRCYQNASMWIDEMQYSDSGITE